ncbi:MAG: AIPR family protein [Petrimonas sp.]|nr:AIPR family protein [Petrimonas sp.]
MNHLDSFKKQKELIDRFGEGNAHLAWVMSLYLDHPSALTLGSEGITDGGDDKKIDFIKLDYDLRKIVFAQGYYSNKKVESAPANKASDLNTASAWLISGDTSQVPNTLKTIIDECRLAIAENEIDQIELLYVHNLPESVNVSKELDTVAKHLSASLPKDLDITVIYKELGLENTERLYLVQESSIIVQDAIDCPAKIEYQEQGPNWTASIMSVPGYWLRDLFLSYGDELFSANYRGFLGVNRRKKINSGIKTTAEKQPQNFWVFNNGITILTTKITKEKTGVKLQGISIINGAQTTGSIGSLDGSIDLKNVKVLSRIIECFDHYTIDEIVKYNNTQNKITTWDKFSNDPQQKRIQEEFLNYGHNYSLKRGFDNNSHLGIEVVAQPAIALEGHFQEANGGKNGVFESDKMYRTAFEDKKAKHLLFVYVIARGLDERRNELKRKQTNGSIIDLEQKQLVLLRNLRFKYFFISVFGKTLNVILGRNVDVSQIGFTPNYCKVANKSLNDLIAEVLPVINLVLTYSSTFISEDFGEFIRRENAANTLSDQVKSIIYAIESANPSTVIENFRQILCE